MTIDELKRKNEELEKDILYFKMLYENKLHETSDWIKIALNRQNIIDELGGKLSKNNDNAIKALQEKLDIAIEALEYYAHQDWWNDAEDDFNNVYTQGAFEDYGYKTAQEALAKIKEIK